MIELIALFVAGAVLMGLRTLKNRVAAMETQLETALTRTKSLQEDMAGLRARARDQAADTRSLGPRIDPAVAGPDMATPPAEPVATAAAAHTPWATVPPAGAAGAAATPGATASVQPARTAAAAPTVSLEERLGTRWAVWVGGIALALGGLLLVRYSIEQGYFGPGVRVVMGLLFAAALVAAGEWFRRSERKLPIDAIPTAHIPSILTAAGTSTAFGTIYAAHALYGFIGSATAFVALGAVAVVTMLAAALHGPALAGLGLAGSYVAPLLVSSAKPSPWPVVIYLAVVAAAAMGLARLRHWLWLALLAIAGAGFWGLPYLGYMGAGNLDWTLAGYVHALIQTGLAAAFIAWDPHRGRPDQSARIDPIASLALGALTLLVVAMLGVARLDIAAAMPFALAAAGILLLAAWMSPPAAVAAPLAGLVVLAAIARWPGTKLPPGQSLLGSDVEGLLQLPTQVTGFLGFAGWASLGVAVVATLRLDRGRALAAPVAGVYALAATLTPLIALILAYLRVTQFDRSIPFACTAAALALLFAWTAERWRKAELAELPGTRLVTGAFAAAAIAAGCLALVFILDRGYLTLALALAAAGTAWVAVTRDIPLLRHVVTALAAIVLARLAWNPRIMGDGVGSWPILNWLLVGYGIPAAAFWGAARLLETRATGVSPRIADAVAILLAGLFGFFQIHHLLNAGDILAPVTSHVEQGLLALIAIGFSYALMRLDLGRANPVFHWASIAFGILSGLLIVVGLGVFENPLFTHDPVAGPPIASSLALAYLLPGLAAVLLARASRPHRPGWYVSAIAVLAAGLIFAYVTLETRHVFQGSDIGWLRRTSAPEQWAYSAVWLALGIVFLAYGIWRGSWEARLASALLVGFSVLKVFLLDFAGLTGLWRALSFIILGLVLMALGLAYQRLVFARPTGRPGRRNSAAERVADRCNPV